MKKNNNNKKEKEKVGEEEGRGGGGGKEEEKRKEEKPIHRKVLTNIYKNDNNDPCQWTLLKSCQSPLYTTHICFMI